MKFKINNNTYKLFLVRKDDERLLIEDDGKYHTGVTDFIKKEIYIRNDIKEDTLKYTLLHELTHAFIDSYGLMQIYWSDEIVADFVASYLKNIIFAYNRIGRRFEHYDTMQ